MRSAWPQVLLALLLVAACAPAAAPAPASSPAPTAPTAASKPAAATPASTGAAQTPAAASKPSLPTTPAVDLKIGLAPIASYGAFFIAQERGYFKEAGLNVEFFPVATVNEALPALAQGQLQVGPCASNVGCFNALNRRTDLQIVADIQSAGKTEQSTGNSALVVRKDLWDNGTIREPRDLLGRSMYVIAGEGGNHHAQAARWLQRNGVDPRGVEWHPMPFPEILAAMGNRAIEVGMQTEPLVTVGVSRGIHHVMAVQEQMHPGGQVLYMMYSSSIERMGPMVGERVMVAYLRGVRALVNAFEYGVDQDAIIDILVKETTIKDPAVFREIRYGGVDPNGTVSRAGLDADIELFRELGTLTNPVDLSPTYEDKYRQFAVQHLGEYRPPR